MQKVMVFGIGLMGKLHAVSIIPYVQMRSYWLSGSGCLDLRLPFVTLPLKEEVIGAPPGPIREAPVASSARGRDQGQKPDIQTDVVVSFNEQTKVDSADQIRWEELERLRDKCLCSVSLEVDCKLFIRIIDKDFYLVCMRGKKLQDMSNINTTFLLLGLMEMDKQNVLYFSICTIVYLFILAINGVITLVIVKERSLHEPMYILIASLILNEIFGSSSFFPKLILDLIISSKTISRINCLIQTLCVSLFALFEMSTFSLMACDRYLAICHPLHYVRLMTTEKVVKLITGSWVMTLVILLVALLLTEALPLCGDKINNIFCENMSLVVLSCTDSTTSRVFSITIFLIYLVFTVLVTIFSYLRIFVVCQRLSKESQQKAVHTLVTHLLNFSVFLIGLLFVVLRYRLGNVEISLTAHVLLSATPLVFPPLCNPLIYGIRTQALKIKVVQYLWKTLAGIVIVGGEGGDQ
ncbi:olfactory receptor 4B13-like [Hyperolius riggenbachi]|uniref:olfactory receptor 4B13-like n=1 Tax=Hyperolius riggenbachi TaxID=752182 RepID=UPI0035A33502